MTALDLSYNPIHDAGALALSKRSRCDNFANSACPIWACRNECAAD